MFKLIDGFKKLKLIKNIYHLFLLIILQFYFSCTNYSPQYNVLFIAVDDLNDWVGFMDGNHQTRTPNMDNFADKAMVFENAHCPAPLCSPSRTAVMSGIRPSTSGIYNNSPHFRVSPVLKDILTMPEYFAKHGNYFTSARGKIFHNDTGQFAEKKSWVNFQEMNGITMNNHKKKTKNMLVNGIPYFDRKQGSLDWGPIDVSFEESSDAQTALWAVSELKKNHERPFFLACGIYRPHLPWHVPKEFFDKFPIEDIILPDINVNDLDDIPIMGIEMSDGLTMKGDYQRIARHEKKIEAVQAYLASINYADECVGLILDALDNSKYKDNTIVVLWGDHGWHFGEKLSYRKSKLWEESTRVPLVISVPGITEQGSRSKRTVNLIDIYPTLIDLCDLPRNKTNEARSITPVLKDSNIDWPYPSITTMGYGNHAIRSEEWRYIQYKDGMEELYNKRIDPLEWSNLASEEEYVEIKEELKKWLPGVNNRIRMKEIGKRGQRKKIVTGLY